MATRNHNYTIDLDKPLSRQNMGLLLATGDSNGDVFNFDLTRSGTAESLSGAVTVAGYFVRNDAATIAMYGSYSGNRASVTLPASCYVEDGNFTLAVRVTAGGAKTTIAVIDGYIRTTTTDVLIDPGTVVPTLDDVLNSIAEMKAVTAEGEATIAAIKADTAAAIKATNEATAATQTATVELAKTAAPAITPTVSGSIVSIADGAERPAVSLVSHIEPVQEGSGDPSPDNVRAIGGWDSVKAWRTGKNLLSNTLVTTTKDGITFTVNDDGDVTLNGTALSEVMVRVNSYANEITGLDVIVTGGISTKVEMIITDNVHAELGVRETGNGARFNGYDNAVVYLNVLPGIVCNNLTVYPMIRPASITDAKYEPYQGQTLTASLPETVYGGDMYWNTGKLYNRYHKIVFDGTETWEQFGSVIITSYFAAFNSPVIDLQKRAATVCSHYPYSYGSRMNTCDIYTQSGSWQVRFRPDMDVDAWKAYLSAQYAAGTPVQIAYPLETAAEYQLTPQQLETLKGTNNVWSDTGDTDLTYIADTQMYIDNKFNELNAALLSTGANV